jgi:2,4-dienoyl-CoA reductase-like NADH-dependent reductase (Old Yellow Enzyme family)
LGGIQYGMATGKALPDGHVSPEMLAYYREKSAGG